MRVARATDVVTASAALCGVPLVRGQFATTGYWQHVDCAPCRDAAKAIEAARAARLACTCGDDHDCRSTGCDDNCAACN